MWGSWDYATTWSSASRLKAFLKNDVPGGTDMGSAWGGATNSYTPNSVVTGDVLFYDWGKGEGVSHAAIQTGIGNDANYPYWGNYVDYHSNDTRHRFWSLKPSNPYWQSTTVYFVHIWTGN